MTRDTDEVIREILENIKAGKEDPFPDDSPDAWAAGMIGKELKRQLGNRDSSRTTGTDKTEGSDRQA